MDDACDWIEEAVASMNEDDFRRAQVEAILAVAAALVDRDTTRC